MRRDDQALVWLRYAAARSREERNGRYEIDSHLNLAATHRQAGRLALAQAALADADAALQKGDAQATDLLLAADRERARLALQRGDVPQARALMQAQLKKLDYAGPKPRASELLHTLPVAARAALAAGELDEAGSLADAALVSASSTARLPEQSSRVGQAWWLKGDVQQQQGLPREALASWQRALPILTAAWGAQHPQTKELQAQLAALR
jgi:tetratricopeptide (TPR) repeat protein